MQMHPAPLLPGGPTRDARVMDTHDNVTDLGSLRELVHLLGGTTSELATIEAHVPVALRRLQAGAALVHEGAPLHSLHVVRCGSLKCVRTLEDGYEQVTAFALPRDVLGFEGLHAGRHATTDIALEYTAAYALPLVGLQALRERCPALDRGLMLALSRQLARATATADMLAAVAAEVRLSRFILSAADRAAALGWSPRRLRLCMCRRDIASLLGMAHETVSRSFTALSDAGVLKVHNREIEILDLAQLHARALATRRLTEFGSVMAHPEQHTTAHAADGTPWRLPEMAPA
jgi:CRP/FNR family transcriptional regulator, anaerobic regulatory protein